ncbi:MAG: hypothetical protein HC869_18525 [Rhodospirillales bacterium]|nr:hypothetical protein [Rhodospirillales bacterium]
MLTIQQRHWRLASSAIQNHGRARQRFHKAEKQLEKTKLLAGNDNKVGIAGEFWAKWHYCRLGAQIIEVMPPSNEGYDFVCRRGSRRVRISVKVISAENKRGRQLRLKSRGTWDEICLVLLNTDLTPSRIGVAGRNDFLKAQKARKNLSVDPIVTKFWLGPKGWLTQHGQTRDYERRSLP